MSFKLLKQAITDFRQKSRCPFCKSRFTEDSISVVASLPGRQVGECQGLFFIICPKCSANAWLIIGVRSVTEQLRKTATVIGSKDITEMHNFLQTWQGDLKELLT